MKGEMEATVLGFSFTLHYNRALSELRCHFPQEFSHFDSTLITDHCARREEDKIYLYIPGACFSIGCFKLKCYKRYK